MWRLHSKNDRGSQRANADQNLQGRAPNPNGPNQPLAANSAPARNVRRLTLDSFIDAAQAPHGADRLVIVKASATRPNAVECDPIRLEDRIVALREAGSVRYGTCPQQQENQEAKEEFVRLAVEAKGVHAAGYACRKLGLPPGWFKTGEPLPGRLVAAFIKHADAYPAQLRKETLRAADKVMSGYLGTFKDVYFLPDHLQEIARLNRDRVQAHASFGRRPIADEELTFLARQAYGQFLDEDLQRMLASDLTEFFSEPPESVGQKYAPIMDGAPAQYVTFLQYFLAREYSGAALTRLNPVDRHSMKLRDLVWSQANSRLLMGLRVGNAELQQAAKFALSAFEKAVDLNKMGALRGHLHEDLVRYIGSIMLRINMKGGVVEQDGAALVEALRLRP